MVSLGSMNLVKNQLFLRLKVWLRNRSHSLGLTTYALEFYNGICILQVFAPISMAYKLIGERLRRVAAIKRTLVHSPTGRGLDHTSSWMAHCHSRFQTHSQPQYRTPTWLRGEVWWLGGCIERWRVCDLGVCVKWPSPMCLKKLSKMQQNANRFFFIGC